MTGANNGSAHSLGGRRLYQDRHNGIICGICAGLSDYFGFDLTVTRILAALSLLIFTLPTSIAYVVLALLLPKKTMKTISTASIVLYPAENSDAG